MMTTIGIRPLLRFVGDPFVDTGVAVLENRLLKECAEFSDTDLESQASKLEQIYAKKAWSGYLTVHFPNSCWCNFTMGPENKAKLRNVLLRSFDKTPIPGLFCSYCQRPAQHLADRSMIPMLTGATCMIAGAGGEPGLPVCSPCLYAVQFYPLAALKVSGRPLFWWTPHHEWMYQLTGRFARRVEQLIEGSPEQLPSLPWPSSRLLEVLEEVLQSEGAQLPLVDLIGCHATNYGSGPDYDEIRITRGVLDFLRSAQGYSAYRAIRAAAVETVTAKRKAVKPSQEPPLAKRNFLYEDLGSLAIGKRTDPATIVRKYFRPQAGKIVNVFEVACLFVRKVLSMTQTQVKAIQDLADRLASSRQAEDYLERLFQRRGIVNYVRTLVDISDRMKRAGEQPIGLNTVLSAFDMTNEDDSTSRDGALVRELILIRLIELLPKEKVEVLAQPEPDQQD